MRNPIIQEEHYNQPIINNGDNQELINSLRGQQQDQNLLFQQTQNQEINNINNINNLAGFGLGNEQSNLNIEELIRQSSNFRTDSSIPINQNYNFGINQNDFSNAYTTDQKIDLNMNTTQNGGGLAFGENLGYNASEAIGNDINYGNGGFEVNNYNNNIIGSEIQNYQDIGNNTQIHNSFTRAMMHEITNKPLFSENTLPVQILPEKVNKVIIDRNVSSLPVIYGGKQVTYANYDESNNYFNNLYQNNQGNQGFSFGNYENNTY